MKKILPSIIFLLLIGMFHAASAQPRFKYAATTQSVKGFMPTNTFSTGTGYLVTGKKGLYSTPYMVSIDDDMNIIEKRKIPNKVDGKKMYPSVIHRMGNKYVVFYHYYSKKKLHFGYDLYNPSGGYFDGNYRELTSTAVKRKKRDTYEPYIYENEETGNSLLLLNHKNIKLRYYVIAYRIETKDVKQEMFLFDNRMKVLQEDHKFKLRGSSEDGLSGTYGLSSFEIDEDDNIFILGAKKPKEAKSRKARKAKKKNIEKTELAIFHRNTDGDMNGYPVPLDVEVNNMLLSKKDEQISAVGTYITEAKKRASGTSEGIFIVPLEYDSDLEDLTISDPTYFAFTDEFAKEYNKNPNAKERKRSKRSNRSNNNQKSKRLATLETEKSESGEEASGGNFIRTTLTDVLYKDGNTYALMETQYTVEHTTTSTNSNGVTTTSTYYTYHNDNLAVMKITAEGDISYVVLPKRTYITERKREKGYNLFDYGSSLVITQDGEIHEIDLDDMRVKSKEIKQWKALGNSGYNTQKDGYEFFVLQRRTRIFQKVKLLEVFKLDPPK